MNTFVTEISMNFAIITLAQMTELPGALQIWWSNSVYPTQWVKLVCCLSWKTLIFHYGLLLQLPAETHPLTQDRKSLWQKLTGSYIFRQNHYNCFFSLSLTQIYRTQWRAVSEEKQDWASKQSLKGEHCQNETLNINKCSRQGVILR